MPELADQAARDPSAAVFPAVIRSVIAAVEVWSLSAY
jgi:hypothetical protein